MSQEYKMYLNIGDWSNDGHNQSDKILMSANYPVNIVQQAYKDACKLTGIGFDDDDAKYHEREWEEAKKYQICVDYEEPELTEECQEILKKFGIDITPYLEDYCDFDNFVKLWCDFTKLGLPDLQISTVKDEIPNINGFWDKNLNVGFGYGLYA